jgi:secreted Zn-dependent insulinase-like peptidase
VGLYSRLTLLAQILKEPAFTQLRTREQLGYVVSAERHIRWLHTMIGAIAFRVLSKTHAPEVRTSVWCVLSHRNDYLLESRLSGDAPGISK